MDQKFATLEDLSKHYTLFINRIQQQISTIGGGGAGFIKDLDDVSFDETTGTDKLLIYNGSQWVGIASTALSGRATSLADGATGVSLTLTGNLSVGGTITYDDVTNVDSIGIVTARNGVTLGDNSSTTVVALNAVSTTTTSTDEATADSFDASVYRSAKYQISMTRGSEFHMTEILVIHNGTTTFDTEYGTIKTGVSLATFDSDIDSGNVRLLVTPTSATSTTIQMFRTLIEI